MEEDEIEEEIDCIDDEDNETFGGNNDNRNDNGLSLPLSAEAQKYIGRCMRLLWEGRFVQCEAELMSDDFRSLSISSDASVSTEKEKDKNEEEEKEEETSEEKNEEETSESSSSKKAKKKEKKKKKNRKLNDPYRSLLYGQVSDEMPLIDALLIRSICMM